MKGDYKNGLDEYEFRFIKKYPIKPLITPNIEKWHGEKLEKGEKLLVISEQELGDTIKFMRYIKVLKEKNIDFLFCAQEKLRVIII